MKLLRISVLAVAALSIAAAPVAAKKDEREYVVVNEDVGVPVFPYDFDDKPYVIVAGIEAGVRKATIFSKEPSQEKIYKELWERAEAVDADAVVMAAYGDSKISAFSWGRTSATGIAIRFLTQDEIASGKAGERAADFDPAKHKMID